MKTGKLVLISAALTAALMFLHGIWFYQKYVRITAISMTALDRTEVSLKIPVKYGTDHVPGKFQSTPLSAEESGSFILKTSDREMYISRVCHEFGGLALYHADYQISDETVKAKLRKLREESFAKSPAM